MLFDTEKIKELLRESPGLTGKQIAKLSDMLTSQP
ncbi:hypothetical protein BANRA_05405 [Klebsiella pneumoniae]|nr:hypothetical protein BANRA_05405 [Klebsiella pneumoniae]